MKKSLRFFISGSLQPMFFSQYIKENADKLNIKGFVRKLENSRMEVFVEGDIDAVNQMSAICKRGPKHSLIRTVEEKPEKFQDFRDFKVINF